MSSVNTLSVTLTTTAQNTTVVTRKQTNLTSRIMGTTLAVTDIVSQFLFAVWFQLTCASGSIILLDFPGLILRDSRIFCRKLTKWLFHLSKYCKKLTFFRILKTFFERQTFFLHRSGRISQHNFLVSTRSVRFVK